MELKEQARVHGQWGDEAVRDQPGAGTERVQRIIVLDLKTTPDPPGGWALAKHLTRVDLHRAFTRQWVGLGKNWFGVQIPCR